MNALIGTVGLLVSVVGAGCGIFVYAAGIARRKENLIARGSGFVYLMFAGSLLSTAAMQRALLTHDFSLAYVAENSSRETPLLYLITGMWSSLSGSILLWATILSLYLVLLILRYRKRNHTASFAWTMIVGLVVAAYFFALMLHSANPFITVAHPVADGAGPNPLLQDYPLVAFHPPMLYMGYVGFTIPFSFAISSLITNRADASWAKETRYWALVAWSFLTLGIFLGAWWSYQVLGWGGYWAWDPVENAAFLPWLCGTAYIHSSMSSGRGGNLRIWNMTLLIATFALTILGTFFTRSGVLQSVHSFSGTTLGPELIGFFVFVSVTSIVLVAWRSPSLRSSGFSNSGITRDSTYIINNLLLSAFTFIVLLGTTFPLLAEAVNGSIVSVGPPFFNAFTAPIALVLLFFMTVSPFVTHASMKISKLFEILFLPLLGSLLVVLVTVLLGSKDKGLIAAYGFGSFALFGSLLRLYHSFRTLGRLRNNRGSRLFRVLGGNLAHLGIGIVAIALATSTAFGVHGEVKLAPFASVYYHGHHFSYQGVTTRVTPARTSLRAAIYVDGSGPYYPSISQFGTNSQVVGTPSVKAGIVRDVYLTLDSPPTNSTSTILLGIVIEPLVSWLWFGGALMGVGGMMAVAASAAAKRGSRDPDEVDLASEGFVSTAEIK